MRKSEIESREMYLKAIYNIQRYEHRNARPVDVSKYLEVSKASVSEMVKKMRKQKLLVYKQGTAIRLTKQGLIGARKVTHHYKVLEDFFKRVLKLSEERAAKEACDLEHFFADDTITRLKRLTDTYSK
ncbi:TPA: metal-dependent transcriptional regulator [archaeon]|uniref:Metal-dependent transcriptional regulator n=1 Tax=Candidatus Naiadarchaeum limnaeum TaxID=2756139 RepID=A0A832V4U3_9ARCH|nr:metal-dependent transcriptional regulator [Candidatus Naiadarchaeales archaeon SRR2090153.bin1042]HIK00255.1 metal-dependent transcriptional regulator [Candidatus Naiadarchaeum limnaeum]